MANNVGYLKAENNTSADEKYTPFYAVEPIVKYIKPGSKIWCPFDKEWSAYSVLLKEKGLEVITSHLEEGKDFFEYEPEDYDVIISNPPFYIYSYPEDYSLEAAQQMAFLIHTIFPILDPSLKMVDC